jgi:hypothetical protein
VLKFKQSGNGHRHVRRESRKWAIRAKPMILAARGQTITPRFDRMAQPGIAVVREPELYQDVNGILNVKLDGI